MECCRNVTDQNQRETYNNKKKNSHRSGGNERRRFGWSPLKEIIKEYIENFQVMISFFKIQDVMFIFPKITEASQKQNGKG